MTTCHYAVLMPESPPVSGFDEPCLQSFEGVLSVDGSTAREVHDQALLKLAERYRREPAALAISHRIAHP